MARFFLTASLNIQAPSAANTQKVLNQIQNQLRNGVNVNVNVNVPNQQRQQLQNLNNTVNQTRKSVNAATDSFERFGKQAALSIRRFGAFTIATTAFIKLIGAIRGGVNDAIEFDRQMVRVAQVTQTSVKNLKGLREEITRVATLTGVAAGSLAEVAVTLSQAGISAGNVAKALETLAKTELAATFGNIKDTTEASIAILQQFGFTTDQLEEKLGSVNRVAAAFAVESEDISAAVRRTGGAFAAAGGSFEEFIALFTSVRQTTRESAETIATGFRTIFTRLQRVNTQDSLRQLGINLRHTREEAEKLGDPGLVNQFVGPFEAIKRLHEALTQLRGTDPRFAAIVEELGGFRQISKVIPLIQQFGVAQKALNVAMAGGNSLNQDFVIAQEALAVQIARVREEFSALIRKISESDEFRRITKFMLDMASAAIKLVDSLIPLLPALTAIGAFTGGKAFSSFLGGLKGNLFKFNSGGLVPGRGPNRDTVPATLTKGEYVLRRSAVDAIGVDKLNALNSGRAGFNDGGLVGKRKDALISALRGLTGSASEKNVRADSILREYGIELPRGKDGSPNPVIGKNLKREKYEDLIKAGTTRKAASEKKEGYTGVSIGGPGGPKFGGFFLRVAKGAPNINSVNFSEQHNRDDMPDIISTLEKARPELRGQLGGISAVQVPLALDVINKESGEIIQKRITDDFLKSVYSTAEKLGQPKLEPTNSNYKRLALDSVAGIGFEGVIASYMKEPFDANSPSQTFDFPNGPTIPLFPGAKPNVIRDAKLSISENSISGKKKGSLKDKILNVLSGNKTNVPIGRIKNYIHPFNKGGSAEDTVPAMLTPGEFVVNKKAVQAIGTHNLDKMNKVQKFNRGGHVKKFNGGGNVGGAGAAVGGFFNTFAIISVLQAAASEFSDLNPAIKETVDTLSGITIQLVAMHAAMSAVNFDSVGEKLKKFHKSLDGPRGVLNGPRGPRGLFSSISATRAARRNPVSPNFANQTGPALFNTFSAQNRHDEAGEVFAASKNRPRGTLLSPFTRARGRTKSIRDSALRDITDADSVLDNFKRVGVRPESRQFQNELARRSLAQQKLKSTKLLPRLAGRFGGGTGLSPGTLVKGAGIVGIAGTLAAGAITNRRQELARERIASGGEGGREDFERATMQGGMASGAIGGAAAGAALGSVVPVLGTAVGALAGAAVGFTASVATENKGLNAFLKDWSAGMIDLKTSSEQAAVAVAEFESAASGANLDKASKDFDNARNKGERREAIKAISAAMVEDNKRLFSSDEKIREIGTKGITEKANSFLSQVEKGATSGDFKTVDQLLGAFGTNAISNAAKATGLTLDQVRKQYQIQIDSINNASKVQDLYSNAQAEAFKQFENIRKLNTTIDDSILQFDQLNSTLEAFDAGKITIPDFSKIFENAGKGQLGGASAEAFGGLLSRISSLGPGGRAITQGAQAEATLMQNLPQILERSRLLKAQQTQGGNSEFGPLQAQVAFQKAAREIFRGTGIDNTAVDSLLERMDGVVATAAGKEDQQARTSRLFEKGNEAEFIDSAQSTLINITASAELVNKATEQYKKLQTIIDRRLAIEQEMVDGMNEIVDIRSGAERNIAEILGGGNDRRTVSQRFSASDQKLANLLSGTGLGAGANPQRIAQSNLEARQGLADIQDRVGQVFDPNLFADAQQKFQKQLQSSGRALEFLAKNTEKVSVVQEKLAKLEQQRQERRGVATGFLFGGNEGRLGIAKNFAATALAARNGSVEQLTEEQRSGVQQAIESLRNTRSGIFGANEKGQARTGQEFEDFLLKNAGFGEGISTFSAYEKQNITLLQQQYDAQLAAAQALQDIRNAQLTANANVINSVTGGGGGDNTTAGLDVAAGQFVAAANQFSNAVASIPKEINGSFTHKHEMIFNGLETLKSLEPKMQELVSATIDKRIQKFIDEKLPALGQA